MATVNVTIRMDEQLKAQADDLFSDFGLSLSAAFTMFAKQAVREQRIPFEITRNPVTFASDSAISSISQKLMKQNAKAYEELAK